MPGTAPRHSPTHTGIRWAAVIGVIAVTFVVLAVATSWSALTAVAQSVGYALWIVPGLVALHLGQLLLAAIGWRVLLVGSRPDVITFYRLRILREGIDSLLPVAQVGGEVVGARLLARSGMAPSQAGASVIVDVTIELATQLLFLLAGLCGLVWLSHDVPWHQGLAALFGASAVLACFVLAQRFGVLRVLEGLLRGIARRWPTLAGTSLDGLHAAALDLYRQPAAILRSTGWHLLAWMLGSIETWLVFHVFGISITPLEAFTIESLGMAARSAGFAIPAALGAQEGGFVLAAAALGFLPAPALALSLIKRLRETVVGVIGLGLWWLSSRRVTDR